MTNTEQQEIWKTYPKIPFIQASNLGRIRTADRVVTVKGRGKRLIKGRVLKQELSNNGYMRVQVKINGKSVHLLTHRIIATCFLPNPNNYPVVNHKDNNRANNAVSNLEWCSRQYNEDYKNNFGTSPAQICGQLFGHPVFAVNLKTGRVLFFKSQHEAERQLGVSLGSVNAILKGKRIQAGGYWFTEDESEITEEKIREIKDKIFLSGVIAINPENSGVFWFESQSEAARQLGVYKEHVNAVVKGKQHKTHGYWICYADENAVENVRSKFGDEVARKVEKLLNEHLN